MALQQHENNYINNYISQIFASEETDVDARKMQFDAGVMLMHLRRLRMMQWNSILEKTVESHTSTSLNKAVSDEDILNAVVSKHPDVVFILPCQWNIQLSEEFQSYFCQMERHGLKVIFRQILNMIRHI